MSENETQPTERAGDAAPSLVPRVLGLLMIVLAAIGLLFTVGGLLGATDFERVMLLGAKTERLASFELLAGLAGLATGAMHLTAGIFTVTRRPQALALTVLYAAATVIRVAALIGVYWASVEPLLAPFGKIQALGGYGFGFTFVQMIPALWGILIVILLSGARRRPARTSEQLL